MTKYRDVEAELLPTLLHQKCGFLPEGLSSTVSWKKVQMLYGDFFEIYGDLLLIPTVLNNLLTRSDFEKFHSPDFTLNKYIDSDKAKRADNFKAPDKPGRKKVSSLLLKRTVSWLFPLLMRVKLLQFI